MAKILVVDDEERTAYFIESVLKQDGHQVQRVNHGAKALELLGVKPSQSSSAFSPDLIVLDVMMPEVDGYTVARLLDEDERTRSIPILILTGKRQPSVEMPPNIKLYLEKPFDPHNLRDMVAAILDE